jgi:hypothetical protein
VTPRDKALAEFLEELASYVLAPQASLTGQLGPRPAERAERDEQRERAIRAQVWLQSAAQVLRNPKAVSQYLSAAELHTGRLELVRDYAAKPLPYEPYRKDES